MKRSILQRSANRCLQQQQQRTVVARTSCFFQQHASARASLLVSRMNNNNSHRNMVVVTQTPAGAPSSAMEAGGDLSSSFTIKDVTIQHEGLLVTPACLQRIQKLVAAKQKDDLYLRVYVDAGGCSGFEYKFELDETPLVLEQSSDGDSDEDEDLDLVVASVHGIPRVVTDPESMSFLQGATLDFVQEMIKSSFAIVDNPQSESACGCGSSFALKNFSSNPALD